MNDMQVPAHIAARIQANKEAGIKSAIAEALSGGQSIPHISKRASRFRLVNGGVETVVGIDLDVIIVGTNPSTSKVYFDKPYDSDAENQAPACQSADGRKPDPDVENPVCDSCLSCPMNVLGSKMTPSGAKSKKCGDYRYLAVVPASDPTQVYQYQVSITEMKGLREYITKLANYNIPPEYVVTHLSFDDSTSYPKTVFSQGQFINEKAIDIVTALQQTDEVKVATKQLSIGSALPSPKRDNVVAIETKAKPAQEPAKKAEPEPVVAEAKPAKQAAEAPESDDQMDELANELDNIFG